MSLVYRAKMQRLFTISYSHIMRQGKPSVRPMERYNSDPGMCAYVSSDGCGCAAAPFILKYHPTVEGPWLHAIAKAKHRPDWIKLDPDAVELSWFVERLQGLHDLNFDLPNFIEHYKWEAIILARQYGLDLPEVA